MYGWGGCGGYDVFWFFWNWGEVESVWDFIEKFMRINCDSLKLILIFFGLIVLMYGFFFMCIWNRIVYKMCWYRRGFCVD